MTYTNKELNRMAAGVLGECGHYSGGAGDGLGVICHDCGKYFDPSIRIDYCNDRNHAVRVAQAVDANDLHDVLREMWLSSGVESKISMPVWVIRQPAKTLLLAAFVAHGIMPMDEAKENL